MRRLVFIGVILNAISGAVAVLLFVYQRVFLSVAGARYVATLDRAGVLSEERLAAYDPTLALNMRYSVGDFITQDHQHAFSIALLIWVVIAAVNLAVFLVATRLSRPLRGSDADRP